MATRIHSRTPLAEQITAINAKRTAKLARAHRYNPVGVGRSTGRMRDKLTAKAEAEYYESLARLGVRCRRRAVRRG